MNPTSVYIAGGKKKKKYFHSKAGVLSGLKAARNHKRAIRQTVLAPPSPLH